LLYPIPGVYSVSMDNPLSIEEMVIPLLTNDNGEVEFHEMMFTSDGRTGKYAIRFECLDVFIDT
jgi:hypothetical protein